MKKKKYAAEWLERSLGLLSMCFCLCTSEKQYAKLLDELNVPADSRPMFTPARVNACVHYLDSDLQSVAVVCIDTKNEKRVDKIQVYALLCHEAVHIWQQHKKDIGETQPGEEQEAYAIQSIAQALMVSYDKQSKKGKQNERTH